jgi:hypothetical protein
VNWGKTLFRIGRWKWGLNYARKGIKMNVGGNYNPLIQMMKETIK